MFHQKQFNQKITFVFKTLQSPRTEHGGINQTLLEISKLFGTFDEIKILKFYFNFELCPLKYFLYRIFRFSKPLSKIGVHQNVKKVSTFQMVHDSYLCDN